MDGQKPLVMQIVPPKAKNPEYRNIGAIRGNSSALEKPRYRNWGYSRPNISDYNLDIFPSVIVQLRDTDGKKITRISAGLKFHKYEFKYVGGVLFPILYLIDNNLLLDNVERRKGESIPFVNADYVANFVSVVFGASKKKKNIYEFTKKKQVLQVIRIHPKCFHTAISKSCVGKSASLETYDLSVTNKAEGDSFVLLIDLFRLLLYIENVPSTFFECIVLGGHKDVSEITIGMYVRTLGEAVKKFGDHGQFNSLGKETQRKKIAEFFKILTSLFKDIGIDFEERMLRDGVMKSGTGRRLLDHYYKIDEIVKYLDRGSAWGLTPLKAWLVMTKRRISHSIQLAFKKELGLEMVFDPKYLSTFGSTLKKIVAKDIELKVFPEYVYSNPVKWLELLKAAPLLKSVFEAATNVEGESEWTGLVFFRKLRELHRILLVKLHFDAGGTEGKKEKHTRFNLQVVLPKEVIQDINIFRYQDSREYIHVASMMGGDSAENLARMEGFFKLLKAVSEKDGGVFLLGGTDLLAIKGVSSLNATMINLYNGANLDMMNNRELKNGNEGKKNEERLRKKFVIEVEITVGVTTIKLIFIFDVDHCLQRCTERGAVREFQGNMAFATRICEIMGLTLVEDDEQDKKRRDEDINARENIKIRMLTCPNCWRVMDAFCVLYSTDKSMLDRRYQLQEEFENVDLSDLRGVYWYTKREIFHQLYSQHIDWSVQENLDAFWKLVGSWGNLIQKLGCGSGYGITTYQGIVIYSAANVMKWLYKNFGLYLAQLCGQGGENSLCQDNQTLKKASFKGGSRFVRYAEVDVVNRETGLPPHATEEYANGLRNMWIPITKPSNILEELVLRDNTLLAVELNPHAYKDVRVPKKKNDARIVEEGDDENMLDDGNVIPAEYLSNKTTANSKFRDAQIEVLKDTGKFNRRNSLDLSELASLMIAEDDKSDEETDEELQNKTQSIISKFDEQLKKGGSGAQVLYDESGSAFVDVTEATKLVQVQEFRTSGNRRSRDIKKKTNDRFLGVLADVGKSPMKPGQRLRKVRKTKSDTNRYRRKRKRADRDLTGDSVDTNKIVKRRKTVKVVVPRPPVRPQKTPTKTPTKKKRRKRKPRKKKKKRTVVVPQTPVQPQKTPTKTPTKTKKRKRKKKKKTPSTKPRRNPTRTRKSKKKKL